MPNQPELLMVQSTFLAIRNWFSLTGYPYFCIVCSEFNAVLLKLNSILLSMFGQLFFTQNYIIC